MPITSYHVAHFADDNTTCGPECQRERRLRCCREWYRQHRDEHIAAVVGRRAVREAAGGD